MLQGPIQGGSRVDDIAAFLPKPTAVQRISRPSEDRWDWSLEPVGRLLTAADLPEGVRPAGLIDALNRQDRPWFVVELLPDDEGQGIGHLRVADRTPAEGYPIGVFVLAKEDGWGWTRNQAVRAINQCMVRFIRSIEAPDNRRTEGLQGLVAWARDLGVGPRRIETLNGEHAK